MTTYYYTFHPVRHVDGRMVVASEEEWGSVLWLQPTAKEIELGWNPWRVLIGPEVFDDWDGPIVNTQADELYDDRNGGWSDRYGDKDGHRLKITIQDIRARLFNLIDQCPQVTFCIETDRPGEVAKMMPKTFDNLWLGVGQIRTQADADRLIPEALKVPAAVRYAVVEPTEEIDLLKDNGLRGWDYLRGWNPDTGDEGANTSRLGWLIIRGGDEPMQPDHVRSLVRQGGEAGVPMWFEGWGEYRPIDRYGVRDSKRRHFSLSESVIEFAKVGRDRSGSTIDGREWKMAPGR